MPGGQSRNAGPAASGGRTLPGSVCPRLPCAPSIEPALKTPDGREACNPHGLIPRAVAALKKAFPELRDHDRCRPRPYTSHGQDGVIDASATSSTKRPLRFCRSALVQAEAGVDIMAPSDMMDGGWARSEPL